MTEFRTSRDPLADIVSSELLKEVSLG